MQYPAGFERYLVDSAEECASDMLELLKDSELRRAFGAAAHEHVRKNFLLPRLLRDELALVKRVLSNPPNRR